MLIHGRVRMLAGLGVALLGVYSPRGVSAQPPPGPNCAVCLQSTHACQWGAVAGAADCWTEVVGGQVICQMAGECGVTGGGGGGGCPPPPQKCYPDGPARAGTAVSSAYGQVVSAGLFAVLPSVAQRLFVAGEHYRILPIENSAGNVSAFPEIFRSVPDPLKPQLILGTVGTGVGVLSRKVTTLDKDGWAITSSPLAQSTRIGVRGLRNERDLGIGG